MKLFATAGMSVPKALKYLIRKGVMSPRCVFVDNTNSQYIVVV
jgi:hypothetical protein